MHKISRLLIAIIAMLPALGCGAQVRWLETEHNFGAFNEDDGKVRTEFKFINKSGSPLKISHVRSSCGCTVPDYSKAAILPGDTASVAAVYNPTGRPGRFSKSLVVKFSNDSTSRLLIRGVVIGAQNTLRSRFPVAVGPVRLKGEMIPFGAVKSNRIKSQFFEVYNASLQPVVPTWTNIPPYLRIKAAHDTIMPGEQGVYSMVLSPGASTPFGLITDSVTFNVPGQPPVNIEIAAIIEEDFSNLSEKQLADAPVISTDIDMLDFGTFAPESQGKITRQVRITNSGKSTLILRRVYTADPCFEIKLPASKLKKGKSTTATVTFDPAGFKAPLLNSRLQIISNDPRGPMQTIRLVGIPQ